MRSLHFTALAVLVLALGLAAPALGQVPTGRFALQVEEVPEPPGINPPCASTPNDAGLPCSDYTTAWPLLTPSYVYVVLAEVEPEEGVLGISLGIEYDVGVFSWQLCADGLEFPNAGPNGAWPASGGGNRITWQTCQTTNLFPNGIHAVAGGFYVYAYAGGSMAITPNNNLQSGPELAYANCENAFRELPNDTPSGVVDFGGGGGFNPCGPGSPPLEVVVDVLPGDCPNEIRPKGGKQVRMAVLGTPTFDLNDILPETVMLEGVPSRSSQIRDVSSPGTGASCCDRGGRDGVDDLLLSYPLDEFLVATGAEPGAGLLEVTVEGRTSSGQRFAGVDCVVILGLPGGGPAANGPEGTPTDGRLEITARHDPERGKVLIEYSLPEDAPVRLQVLDVQGRLLREFEVNGERGTHTETWTVGDVPNGVYFTRLVGPVTAASRVVVVR